MGGRGARTGELRIVQEAEIKVRLCPIESMFRLRAPEKERLAMLSCQNVDQQVFHADGVSAKYFPVWGSCATKEGLSQNLLFSLVEQPRPTHF